jgi:predicted alpha/beta hydrolase family esterase
VAPADIDAAWVKPGSLYEDFRPIPMRKLPFPSVIVASTNDPYLSLERANELAAAWGSRIENVGPLQHIGSECKLQGWPDGQRMLEQLICDGLEA